MSEFRTNDHYGDHYDVDFEPLDWVFSTRSTLECIQYCSPRPNCLSIVRTSTDKSCKLFGQIVSSVGHTTPSNSSLYMERLGAESPDTTVVSTLEITTSGIIPSTAETTPQSTAQSTLLSTTEKSSAQSTKQTTTMIPSTMHTSGVTSESTIHTTTQTTTTEITTEKHTTIPATEVPTTFEPFEVSYGLVNKKKLKRRMNVHSGILYLVLLESAQGRK